MSDLASDSSTSNTWDYEVGVDVEAVVARERTVLEKRRREALAAQAGRWRERMKGFCSAAREKVAAAEERAERERREGEALARRNRQLVEAVKRGREKEKVLEEEKIAAKAELILLERDMAKMQKELVINHESMGQFEARILRLESARASRAEAQMVAVTAAAVAASLAWWLVRRR